MIPVGTFPISSDDENCKQNPWILFSGIVKNVIRYNRSGRKEKVKLEIVTLDFSFTLHVYQKLKVRIGSVVQGGAWMYGILYKARESIELK